MTTRPIVLFALQAPTLLQLLAADDGWDLRTEPMGDHEALAERAHLAGAPIPGIGADVPAVIVVCSPAQLIRAKEMIFAWGRDIPIVWAAHNGYEPELLDGWEGPLLTFSLNNLATFSLQPREHAYVIRPHMPIVREFKTISGRGKDHPCFTMQNRPQTRPAHAVQMRNALLASAVEEAGVPHEVYGQDQPRGALGWLTRQTAFRDAPAYVSALPTNAGFGLAEHEALAHGCPLITMTYGDLPLTLAAYSGLCQTRAEMVEKLQNRWGAHQKDRGYGGARKSWAEEGFDALATHYTPKIMHDGVGQLLNGLLC